MGQRKLLTFNLPPLPPSITSRELRPPPRLSLSPRSGILDWKMVRPMTGCVRPPLSTQPTQHLELLWLKVQSRLLLPLLPETLLFGVLSLLLSLLLLLSSSTEKHDIFDDIFIFH